MLLVNSLSNSLLLIRKFQDFEIIGLLGENGCGKSTFMEMLAGQHDKKVEIEGEVQKGQFETAEHSLRDLGVSYKRQHNAPRFRKFPGSVNALLERTIQRGLGDRQFRLLVMKPLNMEELGELKVASLSGGELQRVAICICLGTPAQVYLLDEPSAGLDCEQRVVVAKTIKRWVITHLRKTAFVIEHDFLMASALSDRVIVYSGNPGVECTAHAPTNVVDGMNKFLKALNITFRRDPSNFRPRINKQGSAKDSEQKRENNYYVVDEEVADDGARDNGKGKKAGAGGGEKVKKGAGKATKKKLARAEFEQIGGSKKNNR